MSKKKKKSVNGCTSSFKIQQWPHCDQESRSVLQGHSKPPFFIWSHSSLIIHSAFRIFKQNCTYSLLSVFPCSFLTIWLYFCYTFYGDHPSPLTSSLHPNCHQYPSSTLQRPGYIPPFLCSSGVATAV